MGGMPKYPHRGSTGSVSRYIALPPEAIYAVISNVALIPKWSPECDKVELTQPGQPITVGTEFIGHNHDPYMQWSTTCRVEVIEPNRKFSFRIIKGVFLARSRWTYQLVPQKGGTLVTESYEIIRANPWPIRQITMRKRHDSDTERPKKLLNNMAVSLANLETYLLGNN